MHWLRRCFFFFKAVQGLMQTSFLFFKNTSRPYRSCVCSMRWLVKQFALDARLTSHRVFTDKCSYSVISKRTFWMFTECECDFQVWIFFSFLFFLILLFISQRNFTFRLAFKYSILIFASGKISKSKSYAPFNMIHVLSIMNSNRLCLLRKRKSAWTKVNRLSIITI